MNQKVATMRALVTYVSLRALRLATIIVVLIFITLFAGIWALAYYLSPWWWIFLLPLGVVVLAVVIIRLIIMKTIHAIHRHPFTEAQRRQLEAFTDKLARLAEIKDTPLPMYAFITLRDILRHHDATTLRGLVDDSTTLRSDFAELSKHFGER